MQITQHQLESLKRYVMDIKSRGGEPVQLRPNLMLELIADFEELLASNAQNLTEKLELQTELNKTRGDGFKVKNKEADILRCHAQRTAEMGGTMTVYPSVILRLLDDRQDRNRRDVQRVQEIADLNHKLTCARGGNRHLQAENEQLQKDYALALLRLDVAKKYSESPIPANIHNEMVELKSELITLRRKYNKIKGHLNALFGEMNSMVPSFMSMP